LRRSPSPPPSRHSASPPHAAPPTTASTRPASRPASARPTARPRHMSNASTPATEPEAPARVPPVPLRNAEGDRFTRSVNQGEVRPKPPHRCLAVSLHRSPSTHPTTAPEAPAKTPRRAAPSRAQSPPPIPMSLCPSSPSPSHHKERRPSRGPGRRRKRWMPGAPSYFPSLIAAWAAASRAIGTRNGEHET
jgi:hypothetical protein